MFPKLLQLKYSGLNAMSLFKITFACGSFMVLYAAKRTFQHLLSHGYKIKLNKGYYLRRYECEDIKTEELQCIDQELSTICVATLGSLLTYKIFDKFDVNVYQNKHITIIYDEHKKPVATNIMFDFCFKNTRIYHLGLYLVSKSHQKKGLQKIMAVVSTGFFILKHFPFNVYFTDIGRSATAFKAIDTNKFLINYPTLLNPKNLSKEFIKFAKESTYYFYNNLKDESGISLKSRYDYDNMFIYDSNIKDGDGAHLLVNPKKSTDSRISRDQKYNQFVESKLKEYDEFFIFGYGSIFNCFFS